MYAIIRTGGKQAKVQEGDVIDVERLREEGDVTFTPLLVVGDDGTVVSGRDALKKAKVTAKVVGAAAGPKVDIFKYKAKTGYRRRQGHRQKYTTIEVTKIEAPGVTSQGKASSDNEKSGESSKTATAKKSPSKSSPAKKSGAKSSSSKTGTKPKSGTKAKTGGKPKSQTKSKASKTAEKKES